MDPTDVTVEQLTEDPHPFLRDLRSSAPVSWVPSIDRWLVTSRPLVIEALRDTARFTVDDPRFTTALVVGRSMLSLDGPEHTRHREPFATHFRRSATHQRFTPGVEQRARDLVAAFGSGVVDLRAQLAAPLAALTITDALGLAGVGVDELLGWYRQIVAAVEAATVATTSDSSGASNIAEIGETANTALAQLAEAVSRSLDDPASLVARIAADSDLSPDEIVANTAVMLFGAIETSDAMTSNALVHLLSHDDALDQVAAEPELTEAAVEESLRLEPAATLVDRYVTVDTTLGGVTLPSGAPVALSLAAANRDADYFAEPDRFDITRPTAGHHVSFVHGPHACIGMHLARVETCAAVRAVLGGARVPRLVDPHAARPRGLVFRKPPRIEVVMSDV